MRQATQPTPSVAEPEEKLLTAFHEAGHAVAYIARGYSFRYITLRPRQMGVTGLVAVHRPRMLPLADDAAITLSGPLAEEIAGSLQVGEELEDAAWAATFAVAMADEGGHQEVDAGRSTLSRLGFPLEAALDDMAAYLVKAWPAVGALAQALLNQPRRLDHREALTIVEASR